MELEYDSPLGRSDHFVLKREFVTGIEYSIEERMKKDYNRADINGIHTKFSEINWEEQFEDKSVQEMYTLFIHKYKQIIEEHVPTRAIVEHSKRKPLWLNTKAR